MEVVNNNQKFRVCWMYNHSFIPGILQELGVQDSEKAERMSAKKQLAFLEEKASGITEALGLDEIPPDTTHCLIYSDKTVVASASVVKYYKDTEDRDKARKYSLTKALKVLLPEDKAGRTAFWNAYITRTMVEPTPVPLTMGIGQG